MCFHSSHLLAACYLATEMHHIKLLDSSEAAVNITLFKPHITLDIMQGELSRILYPIFIHCYLELIKLRATSEAHQLLNKQAGRFTTSGNSSAKTRKQVHSRLAFSLFAVGYCCKPTTVSLQLCTCMLTAVGCCICLGTCQPMASVLILTCYLL